MGFAATAGRFRLNRAQENVFGSGYVSGIFGDNTLCREEQGNESETHHDSTTVGSYQLKGPPGRAHTATAHEVRGHTACDFTTPKNLV